MIIPAILERTLEKFNQDLKAVLGLKNIQTVQIDFADGNFVSTKTLTVEEIKLPKSSVQFEAHLMVDHPKNFAAYHAAGFKRIIVHYEAFHSELDLEAAVEEIKRLQMVPAIAIAPTSQVSVIRYLVDTISHFTLLGVVPGKQGQKMLAGTKRRLREMRDLAPGASIEVDGGVNIDNIAKLIDNGATACVVGSGLLTGDIKANYQALLEALK